MTTVKAQETQAMTMAELRKFDGQLFIANKSPNKITCFEQRGKEVVGFELDPQGSPDSIAFLPKEALDVRGLQRLWMKGHVAISTDPEMEEQIMHLNGQAVGVSTERMNELLGHTTEAANSKDMHEMLCLVCGHRTPEGVVDRGRVLQSTKDIERGEKPLCPDHVNDEYKFIPRLTQEKGKDVWKFDAVTVNASRASRT